MSKELHKEKLTSEIKEVNIKVQENEIISFNKIDTIEQSFRVYKDDKAGIHYQQGKMSDKEGFEKAQSNLELNRPYPFELETGVRHRDKVEKIPDDEELLQISRKSLAYLKKNYPDYTFEGTIRKCVVNNIRTNDLGLDYSSRDGNTAVSLSFKHKDSKDISDGYFNFNQRTFKLSQFKKFADCWLINFTKTVKMPKECIIMDQYYGLTGKLRESLNIEALKLGTSLLTGKVGTKVFSENLTVLHDVSDKTTWMSPFWDGDGCVPKGDKVYFIKNGKILRGYADKKTARQYKVKSVPGSASANFSDIPSNNGINFTLKIGKKSVKELLNGKLAIIPIQSSGGGFKEKGEYTMPVQIGLLTDGETILGRVPPFTISTTMFDMFGDDFIGIAKHNKIMNDKVMLFKAKAGKL